MLHPFKNLRTAFKDPDAKTAAPAFSIHSLKEFFARKAQRLNDSLLYTPLERDIVNCHRRFSKNPDYQAILVAIRPDPAGVHLYKNPHTGREETADIDVRALSKRYTLDNGIRLERSTGAHVVMALDLRKPPEEQIRNWQPGTLTFPGAYLAEPLLTVPDPHRVLTATGKGIRPSVDVRAEQEAGTQVFLKEDIIGCRSNGNRYAVPNYIQGLIKRDL